MLFSYKNVFLFAVQLQIVYNTPEFKNIMFSRNIFYFIRKQMLNNALTPTNTSPLLLICNSVEVTNLVRKILTFLLRTEHKFLTLCI